MKRIIILLSFLLISILSKADIIISEIHYNPIDELTFLGDDLEFIEITNTGTEEVNISGYFLLVGITYSFPSNSIIGAGESFVLAKNQTVLESFLGTSVFGQYTGGLKNSTEQVVLYNIDLSIEFDVTYDDFTPWPTLADGLGKSLEYIGSGDPNDPTSWVASTNNGGSPNSFIATSNKLFPIRVNEILANTSSEQILEQIELHNYSDSVVDISTWYVTDDVKNPFKYQFPNGTTIGANGFFVITSDDFGSNFGLSSKGEEVFVYAAELGVLSGYSNGFEYDVMCTDQSYGVVETSTGELKEFILSTPTFGSENSPAQVGPLVITDIMYDPSTFLNDEFIIIKNISDSTVSTNSPYLTDSNALRIDAVNFRFDFNNPYEFKSGQSFILTTRDTAEFRSTYTIDNDTKIFQYTGGLNNTSEKIKIEMPVLRDIDTLGINSYEYDNHFKTLDEVNYQVVDPWPSTASGTGQYISRLDEEIYSSDPALWIATNDPILGIFDSKEVSNSIQISPVPASDYINVSSDFSVETYTVFDNMGNKTMFGELPESKKLNISSLREGIYILSIGGRTQKFVKN